MILQLWRSKQPSLYLILQLVSSVIHCHSCGAEIPKDFLFCGRCGAKVEQATAKSSDDAKNLSALDKLEPMIEETPVVGIASIPPKLQPPSVEAAAAAVDALGVATNLEYQKRSLMKLM